MLNEVKSRLMGKKLCLVLFVVLLMIPFNYSQSYLDNFPGIPIITYGWASNSTWLGDYDYNKVKEMGTDVYIAPDLISGKFETYRQANLKLIPYQINTAYVPVNHIAKYTEGIYSVWEAESVPISQGEIQLSRNTSLVEEVAGVGVKTKVNQAGDLIWGPNYIQPVKYVIDPLNIIYTVKFYLKVEPKGTPVPLEDNLDNICRLEVTSDGTPLVSEIIKAMDFESYSLWKTFEYTYSMNNNKSLNTDKPVQISYLNTGTQNTGVEIFPNVEFKVYFYGTSTNYLDLYVDNILVHDGRGSDLFNFPPLQQQIIDQANNTGNVNQITGNPTDFNNTVVGWYSIDEPSFIDQWACVRKIDSLIKYGTNGKRLVTSIAGSWNGRVYDGSAVYRIDELIRRTGLDEAILDIYIFDGPYEDDEDNYAERNIENMVLNHLDIINNHPIPFVLSLQVGRWDAHEHLLEKIPTPAQLKNTMFLGLLYGAKGVAISNYFYNSIRIDTTSALVAFTESEGESTQYYHEPLWYTVRDEINPLLHGTFGQTLKALNQQYQGFNYDATYAPIISDSYWLKKIEAGTQLKSPLADKCFVDYGYFTDPSDANKKYAMIVNRYYSTMSDFEITLKNLATYKNWEVKNLINNSTRTVLANLNNEALFNDNIPAGDAGFYRILPVVTYGGNLKYSETISGTNTLLGEMAVEAGAILTINGTYNIYKNVTVNAGGSIVINPGAQLKFYDGASLTVNGNLTANGLPNNKITFTRGGTSGYWGGIQLNSGSTGNLLYCDIKNAYYGIYTSNSNPIISNCNITNNNYGLRIYNSYTTPSWSNVHISSNNITNNSAYGLYIYNSSPTLSNNNISSNWNGASLWYDSDPIIEGTSFNNNSSYGLACYGSASPNLNYNSSYNFGGYNRVTGNNYSNGAIRITGSSFPNLGEPPLSLGGYNSILNNTGYEVYNSTSQMIFACNNWWGDDEGLGTSTLYGAVRWFPFLDYDPSPQQKSNLGNPVYAYDEESELPEDLQIANFEQNISEYESSADKFKKHFTENKESKYNSYSAEQHIKSLSCYLEPKAVVEEIEKTLSEKYDNSVQYELLTGLSLKLSIIQQSEKAIEKLDEALGLKLEEEQEDRVLSLKAMVYIYDLKETEKGKAIFEEIVKSSSKDSPWYELATSELNIISSKSSLPKISIESNFIEIPDEYKLVGNYPNPFNPATKISYQLPINAKVTLKIYDLLGSEIATLVNEEKQAGKYEVEFDASNLSSGVYLYRITMNDFVKTMRMMVVK